MAEVTAFRNNIFRTPIYGLPFAIKLPVFDAKGDLITSGTGADTELSKNGDTFADATNEATEIGTTGVYYFVFTAAELTYDCVGLKLTLTNTGAKPTIATLYPEKLMKLVSQATAQAGASLSITLQSAGTNTTDDYYNGCVIYITAGTGSGQCRLITDYTGSTKVAVPHADWATNPSSDSVYNIYHTKLACNSLGAMVMDLHTDVDDIHTDVADIHTDVADIHTDVGTVITNVGDMHATDLPDLHTDVVAVKTVVDAIHTHIDDIHDTDLPAVKTMTDKIGTVTNTGGDATIGAILGDFANSALVTRVADLHTDVADVHTDIGTVITNVGDVHATDLPAVMSMLTDIHGTDLPAVKTVLDNIHDTDLPAVATAVGDVHATDLPAVMSMLTDIHGTDLPAVKSDTAAIKLKTDGLNFTGTDVKATLDGETVDITRPTGAVVTDGSNSATTFKTDLSSSVTDYCKRAYLRFTSGTLINQVSKISGYNGSTKFVTVTDAFTTTPTGSDTFEIVNE